MAKDLLVMLEDQPGEGARLGEALGTGGRQHRGPLRISWRAEQAPCTCSSTTPQEPGRRSRSAGITVDAETDVIVSPALPDPDLDTPGVFGGMARALADAGINISLVYVVSRNRVVLATSDNQRATQSLQSMM